MTQFSDGISVGKAGTIQGSGTVRNVPQNLQNIGSTASPIWVNPNGPAGINEGIPNSVLAQLAITPTTSFTNNLATAQTVAAGGTFTLTAGTGIVSATVNGTPCFDLDAVRNLQFTGTSTANIAAVATVVGFDQYGAKVTQTVTLPAGATTTSTKKAFGYVTSITSTSATGAPVAVGVGSAFGLPFAASDFGYVIPSWNQIQATTSAGFTPSDTTSPATAATGDVRGTYVPQTTAPNGMINLIVGHFVQSQDNVDLAYGVTQA